MLREAGANRGKKALGFGSETNQGGDYTKRMEIEERGQSQCALVVRQLNLLKNQEAATPCATRACCHSMAALHVS
jgi:hypothetical protein